MRQLPADKYNVAWFKLAEFVVRGEKERALGVYRLLMHSVSDEALILQLEADILLSFNDEMAYDRYRAAAHAYVQAQRWVQALAVYEHLATCRMTTHEDLRSMVELCQILAMKNRLEIHLKDLIERLLEHRNSEQAYNLLEQYGAMLSAAQYTALQSFFLAKLKELHFSSTVINDYSAKLEQLEHKA